jgi:hypothetical protein
MSAWDGGCRPGTVKVPSPADTGRPAVIRMLGRDTGLWRRAVRPGKISDGTVENTDDARLRAPALAVVMEFFLLFLSYISL